MIIMITIKHDEAKLLKDFCFLEVKEINRMLTCTDLTKVQKFSSVSTLAFWILVLRLVMPLRNLFMLPPTVLRFPCV